MLLKYTSIGEQTDNTMTTQGNKQGNPYMNTKTSNHIISFDLAKYWITLLSTLPFSFLLNLAFEFYEIYIIVHCTRVYIQLRQQWHVCTYGRMLKHCYKMGKATVQMDNITHTDASLIQNMNDCIMLKVTLTLHKQPQLTRRFQNH